MCVDGGLTAGALRFLVSNRMASRIWWTSYTKVFLFTLTCTPGDPKWLSKCPVAQTLQPWFYSTAARDYYSQKSKPFCQKQTTKNTSSKELWSNSSNLTATSPSFSAAAQPPVEKPRLGWETCRTRSKAGSLEGLGLPSSASFSRLHHGRLNYFQTLGKIISLGNFLNLIQTQLFFLHSQFQNFLSLITSMTDELGNICLVLWKYWILLCVCG